MRFQKNLSSFASNSPRQLDVLWHDSASLGVDSAQIGVFEEANQVRLLERSHSGALKAQIGLEVLGDLAD